MSNMNKIKHYTDRLYYRSAGVVNSNELPIEPFHLPLGEIWGRSNPNSHDGVPVPLIDFYSALAIDLADERGKDLDYLIPGMVSEYGEVVGKFAKSYWHNNWTVGKLSYELALELGDIMWMVGVLYYQLNPRNGLQDYPEGSDARIGTPFRTAYQENLALHSAHSGQSDITPRSRLRALGQRLIGFQEVLDHNHASSLNGGKRHPFEYGELPLPPMVALNVSNALLDIWVSLLATTASITGINPIWVMDMNIEKLTSRSLRGTLQGNGDHR